MKRFNVATKKVMSNREKPLWRNIGQLVYFEPNEQNPHGGYTLELFMFPGTKYYVFPSNGKNSQKGDRTSNTQQNTEEQMQDEDDDTPF